ncbi:hypothetical protein [Haloferax volcanii]|uniref:hypothetical protein n=1 Tax=Haloferax volcanii TaxID=2246 RepID=UPI00249CCD9B|nr:hypothetical protein [Haloferax alexandrinus]WEL29854.1 hypothetical protein HBNXHx_1748 [Haloferax alexandrinus]
MSGENAGETTDDTSDSSTTSTAERFWLTNDGLAWLLVGSFPLLLGIAAAEYLDLAAVPESVLLSWLAFVGIAVAWTFGADAVSAWRSGGDA